MIILDQIKIRNLRSLKDTGYIDIKPLTVLVGKNSSGKSTFLRFFPLMKQTLSTKKNEPVLWYSKEQVDFGSFEESINKNHTEGVIGFDFNFDIISIPISLSVDLSEKILNKISITIFENKITFFKNEDDDYNLVINNIKIEKLFKVSRPNVFETFIPLFALKTKEIDSDKVIKRVYVKEYFKELLFDYVLSQTSKMEDQEFQVELRNDIGDFLEELNIRNINSILKKEKDELDDIEEALHYHKTIIRIDVNDSQSQIINQKNDKENIFFRFLKKSSESQYKEISLLLLGTCIQQLIEESNDYLKSYFKQVHYIAPVRASAQRYYRLQGLSVDEIDPQGENIPMAINHLSSIEKKRFKEWMKSNFGFEIDTKIKSGHVTLNISFSNNENLNLADTGFGFSQILPIILLLWRMKNLNHNKRLPRFLWDTKIQTILIEQPELHLHPALQARLTDALVSCIKEADFNEVPLRIIIETHSETIINRIGQLVYKEKINQDKVNILIFGDLEKQNHSDSCINSVSFDEEGSIKDWPLGFFYPEV